MQPKAVLERKTHRTDGQEALLIGGGHFGRLALRRLAHRIRLVIEPRPDGELRDLVDGAASELLLEEGAAALQRLIHSERCPPWVIPAIPRHLLVDWLLIDLAPRGIRRREVPLQALPRVPSLTAGADGQMLLSLADFRCPDDCPEPALTCTVTGQPRGRPLFERLAGIELSGWSLGVIRSHQLAPGVGGCRAVDLLALAARMSQIGGNWLAATACRCHGVVGALGLPGAY